HCAVDPVFWPQSVPARELELHQFGLNFVEVDPGFVYLHPTGESVAFWRDPVKTARDMARFHRADGAAYLELADLFEAICDVVLPMFATNPLRPDRRALTQAIRGAVRHRAKLTEVGAFLFASGQEAIAERFVHPVNRSALNIASACLYPSSFPS